MTQPVPTSRHEACAFTLVAILATPPAIAETLPESGAERIEEILVTARKRHENSQEVGLALTVIGGETLEALRYTDPRDLVLQVPSLQMQSSFGGSNPAVFLRGVGVNDVSPIASGAVSFTLDGVTIGAPAGQLFQFFDLDRVEVLRGPQGTLYGRNTTAGAINFLSRDPTQAPDARLRVSYGRYDERVVEGVIGGPLSERWSARLAVVSNQRDGYVENLSLGTDDTEVDNWAGRLSLRYQSGSDFEATLKLYSARSDAGSRRNKSRGLLDPASLASGVLAPCATPDQLGSCSDPLGYIDSADPYTGNWNRPGDEEITFQGASAALSWHLDGLRIHSLTGFNESGRRIDHDSDGSPNRLLEIDWQDDSTQWSQELRVDGSTGRSDWIAGLYYYTRDVDMNQRNDLFRELRPITGFDPSRGVFAIRTTFDADVEAAAAFGEMGFQLGTATRMILGLRYTTETHEIDRFDRIEEPDFVIPLVDLRDRVEFDDVSGRVGLEYTTAAGNLLHAGIARGFKSGGFSGAVAVDPESVPPFDEETLISYEVGYKWRSPTGRLRVNTAAFLYDYSDLQVFTRINTGGIPREVLTNAADAEVVGLEVEASALTPGGWDLTAALGWLDTELEDFQTFGGRDFSGNDLVYAPDVTLSGRVGRQWPVPGGSLRLQADVHHQDDVFFDTSNDPLLSQGGYTIVNGRLAYRSGDGHWEVALWGRNLGDTEYQVAVIDLSDFGFQNVTFGEPLTWGVEVIWRR